MIIKLDDLKPICSKVLFALDPSNQKDLSDVVQIQVTNETLVLSVSNGDYRVDVSLLAIGVEDFKATVDANSFLKLINQFTKDEVSLDIKGNALIVKCDGTYKIPLIYEDDHMLELPVISISNITNQFETDASILKSILDYNSKEFSKGVVVQPVQSLYYIDNQGAITFTSGACVNKFLLPDDVKLLLDQKLVRLFKLFEDTDTVALTLGKDKIAFAGENQKIKLESNSISISAKLSCDPKLLKSVPVSAIRSKVEADYPYSVTVNKNTLIKALNRLLIFDKERSPVCKVTFDTSELIITSASKPDNVETIQYEKESSNIAIPYTAMLNLRDLKLTLENCSESYIVISAGNNTAISIVRNNIFTILPEYV